MTNDSYKEVYYHKYCKDCVHFEKKENEEPCSECLEKPTNYATDRPVKFEKK